MKDEGQLSSLATWATLILTSSWGHTESDRALTSGRGSLLLLVGTRAWTVYFVWSAESCGEKQNKTVDTLNCKTCMSFLKETFLSSLTPAAWHCVFLICTWWRVYFIAFFSPGAWLVKLLFFVLLWTYQDEGVSNSGSTQERRSPISQSCLTYTSHSLVKSCETTVAGEHECACARVYF